MSGICGWNESLLEKDLNQIVLERMALELQINKAHLPILSLQESFALAAVGLKGEREIFSKECVHIVYQGRIYWAEAKFDRYARKYGMALSLLEAYRREGIQFLQGLMGSFSLALFDQNNILLAIDRSGIQSLFYSQNLNRLFFASNARSLIKHPDVLSKINPQSLFDYVYFHMVPSPACIFMGIEKLLPGQYVLIKDQKLSKDFYWQPRYEESSELDEDSMAYQLRSKLKAAVSHSVSNPNTGSFLSGGTDSSTITGFLRQRLGKPIDAFSIGFEAEGFDEIEYARIAAKHFNVRHHEYYLRPQDIVDALPSIVKAYDEPFGNASVVPAFYCAKLAHEEGIEFLLAGDGGDELFAGNSRYAKQKVFEFYAYLPESLRAYLIEPLVRFDHKSRLFAKLKSYVCQAKIPLPERLETYNFLNRLMLETLFEPDFLAEIDKNSPVDRLHETYHRARAASTLNRMLFLDLKFTLADNDLRKVNRMCELAQLEVRYPMLDDMLLEFSLKIPSSLKLRRLRLRHLFKHAFKDFLPNEIIKKSKHGFGLPFGLWMNQHPALKEIAFDSLDGFSKRGIVKPEFITHLKSSHIEAPNYFGVMIWVLMMLELWFKEQK